MSVLQTTREWPALAEALEFDISGSLFDGTEDITPETSRICQERMLELADHPDCPEEYARLCTTTGAANGQWNDAWQTLFTTLQYHITSRPMFENLPPAVLPYVAREARVVFILLRPPINTATLKLFGVRHNTETPLRFRFMNALDNIVMGMAQDMPEDGGPSITPELAEKIVDAIIVNVLLLAAEHDATPDELRTIQAQLKRMVLEHIQTRG